MTLIFLGRQVNCFDDKYPGRVEEFKRRRATNLSRDQRLVFKIRYYYESIGVGTAKKVLKCSKNELPQLLVVREHPAQRL